MIDVTPADGRMRAAALEILFAHLPPAERKQQIDEMLAAAAPLDLSELLIGTRNGEPVGAALSIMQPDGCGFLWPPRSIADENAAHVIDALFVEMLRRHDSAGVWISQCVLDLHESDDRRDLERNGFQHLADLRYLHRDLAAALPEFESSLEVVAVSPDDDPQRIAAIIEATYEQTRDCPELNGLRTGLEAVAGHKTTGGFLPNDWYLFRDGETDIAVLILADQPEQDAWEVVYMGVAPAARGRGFGRAVVRQAIRAASRSPRRSLLLAVDGNNAPAFRIYESHGFEPLAVKAVYVRRGRNKP